MSKESFQATSNVEKPRKKSAGEVLLQSLRSRARLMRFVTLVELGAVSEIQGTKPREVPIVEAHEATETTFRGFEPLGYQERSLRRFFGAFPEAWSRPDAIGHVTYVDEHLPMPTDYHIAGYEGGHCTLSPGREPSEIVITRDAIPEEDTMATERIFGVITHELAHANDPMNATDVVQDQRNESQTWLMRRVTSEQRLRFPYVEHIQNDNAERQQGFRAQEYFAELVRVVMEVRADAPDRRSQENWESFVARKLAENGQSTVERAREDVSFLVRYGHMFDPTFSWEDAQRRFRAAIQEVNHDRGVFQTEAILNQIEDGVMQAACRRALFAEQSEVQDSFFLWGESIDVDNAETGLTPDRLRLRRGLNLISERWNARVEVITNRLPESMHDAFNVWADVVDKMAEFRTSRWANGIESRNISSEFHQMIEEAERSIPSDATAEDRERLRQVVMDYVVVQLFGNLGLNAQEQRLVHNAREIWQREN